MKSKIVYKIRVKLSQFRVVLTFFPHIYGFPYVQSAPDGASDRPKKWDTLFWLKLDLQETYDSVVFPGRRFYAVMNPFILK